MTVEVYKIIFDKTDNSSKYNILIKDNKKESYKIINKMNIGTGFIMLDYKLIDFTNLSDVYQTNLKDVYQNLTHNKISYFKPRNFWNKQKLLWMYKNHWIQKESNFRYIINIIFLILGLIVGILNIIN